MNKIIYTSFAFLLLNISNLSGVIIETSHFCEINEHITPQTLVILDIDDTLLIPTQTLGTDVWFLYRIIENEKLGLPKKKAFERALAEWEATRHITQVKLVEIGTDTIIDNLQKQNLMVIGLTSQGLALATRTVQQLNDLNIDLIRTAPSKEDLYFNNGAHGVLYRQGIIFTSGTKKGKALLTWLDTNDLHPERILFINDKLTHLRDVEEDIEARGINFIGLRYNYSDDRVKNFRKDIADIQWKYSTFQHILSDEEAEALL